MDVISFLCVPLGSSTVQLHDSFGSICACSEVGFSIKNSDRACGIYYRRAAFYYESLGVKELSENVNHKQIFPV
jgi:hypothetical protein